MNRDKPSRLLRLLAWGLAGSALGLWLALAPDRSAVPPAPPLAQPAGEPESDNLLTGGSTLAEDSDAWADFIGRLRRHLNRPDTRDDEAILLLRDEAALHALLARADSAGVALLSRIDGLHALRVRVTDYAAFARELAGHSSDYARLGPNPLMRSDPPAAEDRSARLAAPVGNRLLASLGVESANADWGRGVIIAILDGGASPDPSLGTRLGYLDIGYGISGSGTDGLHATAVAAIAAGAAADARGVAPAASLLSVRVTDAAGASDAFTVAKGILAAIDAGAHVINISMGGHATSPVLGEAIEQALTRGIAVVAAAGNDQASVLAWPAAYPGVVSVGAVDAAGQQAIFSNSGPSLQLTAPGYAIQTAGLAGSRIEFSGTSASAPVVSGAIAALLSSDPALDPLAAADLLAAYSNEAGPLGADPDYGRGTLNLGWALDRSDKERRDPAISALRHDTTSGRLDIVVQNRGAVVESGLELAVSLGSDPAVVVQLPVLEPGASTVVELPATAQPDSATPVRSQLILPAGADDRIPDNNRRAGALLPP